MSEDYEKGIEVIIKGHPKCNHRYVFYQHDKESQFWICDAPGCKKQVINNFSENQEKKMIIELPPDAYVSVENSQFGGPDFYGLRTDGEGQARAVEKNKWLDRNDLINMLADDEIFD